MKKRLRLLVLTFVIGAAFSLCFASTVSAAAREGDLSENVHWRIEAETLIISGRGDIPKMDDYPFDDSDRYVNIVLEDGITSMPSTKGLNQTAALGKDVRPEGLERVSQYIVDPENPYLSMYEGGVYSKNYKTLYAVSEDRYGEGREVLKLHWNVKEIKTADRPTKAYELNSSNPYYTVYDGALFSKDLTSLYLCPLEKKNLQFPAATRVLEYDSAGNEMVIPEGVTTWKGQKGGKCVIPNSMVNFEGEPSEAGQVVFSKENKAAKEYFKDLRYAYDVPQEILDLYQSGKRNGWQTVNGHTYYFYSGSDFYFTATAIQEDKLGMPGKGWERIDGGGDEWVYQDNWYYFDPETYILQTGFQRIDGKAYFLGTTGEREHDKWKFWDGDWYCLNSYGAGVVKCWRQNGNKWYYLQADGTMAKSKWIEWYHKWYYVGSDGAMYTNRRTPDGYWVNASGVWVK